jgi:hypothetical protein
VFHFHEPRKARSINALLAASLSSMGKEDKHTAVPPRPIAQVMLYSTLCTVNPSAITPIFLSSTLLSISLCKTENVLELSHSTWKMALYIGSGHTRLCWPLADTGERTLAARALTHALGMETPWSFGLVSHFRIWNLCNSIPPAFMVLAVLSPKVTNLIHRLQVILRKIVRFSWRGRISLKF